MFRHHRQRDRLVRSAFLTAMIPILLATVLIPARAQNGPVNASTVTRIYDIQYTTDPSGNSPYRYQYVTVRGVVTAIEKAGRQLP